MRRYELKMPQKSREEQLTAMDQDFHEMYLKPLVPIC
jgi:hypothetical protein